MKKLILIAFVVVLALMISSVAVADDHDNGALVFEGNGWIITWPDQGIFSWRTFDSKAVFNNGGNAMATIHWTGQSFEQQRIPDTALCQFVGNFYGIPLSSGYFHFSDEGVTLKCFD